MLLLDPKVSQHVYDKEHLKQARGQPDYKESFESGNVHDESQPNIWLPEDTLPGFRGFMETTTPCVAISCTTFLMGQASRSMCQTPGSARRMPNPCFQLRQLHYPRVERAELEGWKRNRINAHSDIGTLTLLFQDSVGGLKIEDPPQAGVFRPAPPVQDAVSVNIGDFMAQWSNDRWKSTVHKGWYSAGCGRAGDG